MDKSHPVPRTQLQCPSRAGNAAGQGMQWDRECCGIQCPSNARHNAGDARRLHGTRWVHGMDLLGAAGELGMCGSKEELCLQLLIGVHVCECVCVHHCHPQKSPAPQQGGIQDPGGSLDPPQEPQPRMISGWVRKGVPWHQPLCGDGP